MITLQIQIGQVDYLIFSDDDIGANDCDGNHLRCGSRSRSFDGDSITRRQ